MVDRVTIYDNLKERGLNLWDALSSSADEYFSSKPVFSPSQPFDMQYYTDGNYLPPLQDSVQRDVGNAVAKGVLDTVTNPVGYVKDLYYGIADPAVSAYENTSASLPYYGNAALQRLRGDDNTESMNIADEYSANAITSLVLLLAGIADVFPGGKVTKPVRRLLDDADNIVTGAERDANFKNWFGDSKVVDEAGEPLTVYHGSADDIKAFNLGHPNRKDSGWLGEGVYTTDNADIASTYSIMKAGDENPNVMPLNLSLKNPYYATIEEKHSKRGKAGAKEFTEKLKEMGHDGVILKYGGDDAPNIGNREFVVFEPTQIKSIHNRGTYNPKDANILKGIAPIAGAGLLSAGMMRQEDQQQGILN